MTWNMIRKLFSLDVQAEADKMKRCYKSERIKNVGGDLKYFRR